MILKKAEHHQNQTVRRDAASPDFIEVLLQKELFQDEHENWENLIFADERFYQRDGLNASLDVERNVDFYVRQQVAHLKSS